MPRNHKLSQNFLRSPRIALTLIGHSNIKKNDLVVEIGAGSGVITSALAKRCREVWAYEPDPVQVKILRENLKRENITNVRIIEKDFLKAELPRETYKVFSNPPFHISAEILYKLLGLTNNNGRIEKTRHVNQPDSIYLILQKQLALKMIPTDRHYTSQLGRIITSEYNAKIRYPLKPWDFTPPPAVPTVLYEAKLIKK